MIKEKKYKNHHQLQQAQRHRGASSMDRMVSAPLGWDPLGKTVPGQPGWGRGTRAGEWRGTGDLG